MNNRYINNRPTTEEDEEKQLYDLLTSDGDALSGCMPTSMVAWVVAIAILSAVLTVVVAICYFVGNSFLLFRGDVAFSQNNYTTAYERYSAVSSSSFMPGAIDLFNLKAKAADKQVTLFDAVVEEYDMTYPVIENIDCSLNESYFTSCGITDGEIDVDSIPAYSEKYEAVNSLVSNIVAADYVTSKNFMIVKDADNTLYTFASAGSTFNSSQIKDTNLYTGETFENVDYFRYFGDVLYVKHLDGTWTISKKMDSFSYMNNVDMTDVEDVLNQKTFKKTDGTYFLVNESGVSVTMYPFSVPDGTEIVEFYGSVALLSDGTLFDYSDQIGDATATLGLYGLMDESLMQNILLAMGDEKIETILQPALYKTFILTEEGSLYYCDASEYYFLANGVDTLYAAELDATYSSNFSYGYEWDFDVYAMKDGKCIPLLTYYVSSLYGSLDYDFDDVRSFYYGGILFRDGTTYPESSTSEYLVDEFGSLVSIYDIVA